MKKPKRTGTSYRCFRYRGFTIYCLHGRYYWAQGRKRDTLGRVKRDIDRYHQAVPRSKPETNLSAREAAEVMRLTLK